MFVQSIFDLVLFIHKIVGILSYAVVLGVHMPNLSCPRMFPKLTKCTEKTELCTNKGHDLLYKIKKFIIEWSGDEGDAQPLNKHPTQSAYNGLLSTGKKRLSKGYLKKKRN